jgi:alpha-glucosidase
MAEFGLGDNLLICPITQAEVDGRWLYLPRGSWYYFWDDTEVTGGKEVWAEANLDRVPLFAKAGAIIPFYPIQQYVGEIKITELTLHVYYIDGSLPSMLYEDSGDGYDYEKGVFIKKAFRVTGSATSLSISQKTKGTFVPAYSNYKIVLHGLPFQVNSCEVDGALVQPDANEEFHDKEVQVITVDQRFQYLVLSPSKLVPEQPET